MPNVQEFFESVARKLAAEAQMASQWLQDKHWPSVGSSREAVLRRFLATYLPKRMVCGTGFILGTDGELSRQCDLLVYEPFDSAPLYVDEAFVVVREEAARLVIESKSTVNKAEFAAAVLNIGAAKSRVGDPKRLPGALFGLEGPAKKPCTVADWLLNIAKDGVSDTSGQAVEVPPEHLVDFVHFADGLQLQTVRDPDDPSALQVQYREFAPGDGQAGLALLCFWDWILRSCRPDKPVGDETSYLVDYLNIPPPEWQDLLTYA